ncbi:MAG: efflux RND transporter periplasmic adaptor subunit [Pseudomonadota bacterium]|nr:efflux RND transporter periplasmic adaptor subunit [Pseudomonadota bacterium]
MGEQVQNYEMTERQRSPSFGKGLLFMLVLVAVLALLGYFVLQNRSAEGPLVPTERPVPISVETVRVSMSSAFTAEEKFTGIVSARRTSQLGFASGGRIDSITADIGDQVETGQTLAVLDTRSLRAQLSSANAVVTEAEAAFNLAKTTVDRQIELLERGHVSSQVVDQAQAQASTAYARIDAAKANADALRVQIDLARIRAPFDGTITARLSDEGAIAAPGVPLFELVETGVLEARIGLTSALANSLNVGQEYPLISDQGEVMATLRSVTGVIDAGNRTVTTIFDISEPDRVAAGAVVRLGIDREIEEPGLWLPVSALNEADRGLWSVYAARRQGGEWIAEPGIVEIVHQDGDLVFVRGALRDGDNVIVDGLQRITPGQPVTPVEVSATAPLASNG